MSITTRLYSEFEMNNIENGNKFFKTIFANNKTFSPAEIKAYNKISGEIKTYVITFQGEYEPVTIKAIDDESALWFIGEEYKIEYLDSISEKTTSYREVEF